jgi:Pyruvate/2-oxoacid:ferredoxin oxidoreductase delta subunit
MQKIGNDKGIPTQLIDIGKIEDRLHQSVIESSLIGFVAPTHGFNFPPIMLHFILRFPRAKSNRVFIMNTRAGMKAGKLFLPGVSGLTQFLAAGILKFKGYKVIAMVPVDLPSNWISLHPGLKNEVVESIYLKQHARINKIGPLIFDGKKNYRAVYDIIQDLIIAPIGIGYYFVGRFLIAKSFIASSACNHCNICIKNCPVKAIKEVNSKPFWTYRCESCMRCMNSCPKRAIETVHGFFAAILILANMVVGYNFYQNISIQSISINGLPGFLNQVLGFIVTSFIYFLLFFSSYFILHFLLKFRWFEKLVLLTSFTHYKFWRRYNSMVFKNKGIVP